QPEATLSFAPRPSPLFSRPREKKRRLETPSVESQLNRRLRPRGHQLHESLSPSPISLPLPPIRGSVRPHAVGRRRDYPRPRPVHARDGERLPHCSLPLQI